ncbi:uncharacterized protein LOC111553257 [Piliocolobus tephrosceles]|uniref:uncharacterized protein LOC111553257 n=1 Tax=Piliocolobus tephrosceles TaxID=591936 RepID=UPI000C2B31D4|nr:uncharacterized protein LOC111553257 [Piliocolobus tephrosceles]
MLTLQGLSNAERSAGLSHGLVNELTGGHMTEIQTPIERHNEDLNPRMSHWTYAQELSPYCVQRNELSSLASDPKPNSDPLSTGSFRPTTADLPSLSPSNGACVLSTSGQTRLP